VFGIQRGAAGVERIHVVALVRQMSRHVISDADRIHYNWPHLKSTLLAQVAQRRRQRAAWIWYRPCLVGDDHPADPRHQPLLLT
jgi:hypothetical protein